MYFNLTRRLPIYFVFHTLYEYLIYLQLTLIFCDSWGYCCFFFATLRIHLTQTLSRRCCCHFYYCWVWSKYYDNWIIQIWTMTANCIQCTLYKNVYTQKNSYLSNIVYWHTQLSLGLCWEVHIFLFNTLKPQTGRENRSTSTESSESSLFKWIIDAAWMHSKLGFFRTRLV